MNTVKKAKITRKAYYGLKLAHLILIIVFIANDLRNYHIAENKSFIWGNIFAVLFISCAFFYAIQRIKKYSIIFLLEILLSALLAGIYAYVVISEYSECSPLKENKSNITTLEAKEFHNLEINTRPSNLGSCTDNLELLSYHTNVTVESATKPIETYDDDIRKMNINLKEKHYYFYSGENSSNQIYKSKSEDYDLSTDAIETTDKSISIPVSIDMLYSTDVPNTISMSETVDMSEAADMSETSSIPETICIHKTELPETTVTPFKGISKKSTKILKCSEIIEKTLFPVLFSLGWQVIIFITVYLYRKYMKEINSHVSQVGFHQTNDGGVVNPGFLPNENIIEELETAVFGAGPSDSDNEVSNIFDLFNIERERESHVDEPLETKNNTPERLEGRTDPSGNREKDSSTSHISELSSDFQEMDESEYVQNYMTV